MIFWRSRWECGIYAIVFLFAALLTIIFNDWEVNSAPVILYLVVGIINLLLWIYKSYKKSPGTADLFSGSKWSNGLYGAFFLGVALILFITEGVGFESAAVQLALLFGGIEAFLFLIRLVTNDKPAFFKSL